MLMYFLDVNECLGLNNPCSRNADCMNVKGSVKCICNYGYQGDGISCEGNKTESII